MKKQAEAAGNRRNPALLALAALIVVFAAGCDVDGPRITVPTVPPIPVTPAPTGPTVTESRVISGVDGVALDAVGHARIALGASESLVITAPESVMDLLTSEVVAGRLILGRDSASYQGQASDIQYQIGLVRLDELILAGVGQLYAERIDTGELRVTHIGVGEIRAQGRADRQEVELNGLGDYVAPRLQTRVTRVSLSSGDAVVWATERIEGWIAAGCRLEYWGNPEVQVSGAGAVVRLGLNP